MADNGRLRLRSKDFAHRLLKDGYTVYVAARSVDKMTDLEEAGAIALKMDISKDEDAEFKAFDIDKWLGESDDDATVIEKFVNEKLKTKTLKVHVVLIPVERSSNSPCPIARE